MINTGYPESISAQGIDKKTALELSLKKGSGIFELLFTAHRVREKFRGNYIDLCSIINAKSGSCPEDCSFCAQSAHSSTDTETYPLIHKEKIMEAVSSARDNGVRRFCIVTSGKKTSGRDLDNIGNYISCIKEAGLMPCATLGMLDAGQLGMLKEAGLHRYHHNLETSENFFSEICTTHTFKDKIMTIEAAKSQGLSVCSGGIFGLGESWTDRIDMAFVLKETGVDSVPINFLTPVKGTALGNRDTLSPLEALKIIAIYRLILPDKEIRVCGGRPLTLKELNSYVFFAGADGLLLGNYLTTSGRRPEDDLQLIRDMELGIYA